MKTYHAYGMCSYSYIKSNYWLTVRLSNKILPAFSPLADGHFFGRVYAYMKG